MSRLLTWIIYAGWGILIGLAYYQIFWRASVSGLVIVVVFLVSVASILWQRNIP